jgi:BASS family bile acid:Na+ symporter
MGVWLTKVFELKPADNSAIELVIVVRNINLGLLLKVSLFPVG